MSTSPYPRPPSASAPLFSAFSAATLVATNVQGAGRRDVGLILSKEQKKRIIGQEKNE